MPVPKLQMFKPHTEMQIVHSLLKADVLDIEKYIIAIAS